MGEVRDGVQAYVVGTQALWAGMQEVQQEDLERAEMSGFPAILIVLLAVFGSVAGGAAAGGPGDRRRDRHGRGRLPALARADDVGVRDQHHLDARHRRGGRLLAVPALALPRGAAGRQDPRAGARRRDAHVRRDRRLLRRDRADLARRAVPDRLDRDPLAGDRRDGRRRALDHLRRHAAAGADRAARPARRRARADRLLHRRAVPPRAARKPARDELLGALDGRGDEAPVALGRAREPRPARARRPRAVAGLRQRRAAPVPGRPRDPPRRRAGRDARPCPARPRRC